MPGITKRGIRSIPRVQSARNYSLAKLVGREASDE